VKKQGGRKPKQKVFGGRGSYRFLGAAPSGAGSGLKKRLSAKLDWGLATGCKQLAAAGVRRGRAPLEPPLPLLPWRQGTHRIREVSPRLSEHWLWPQQQLLAETQAAGPRPRWGLGFFFESRLARQGCPSSFVRF